MPKVQYDRTTAVRKPRATKPKPPAAPSAALITAGASERVEYERQPDNQWKWTAFANNVPVGTDVAPQRSLAEREAWQWIAAHRAKSPRDEGRERAVTTRRNNSKQADQIEVQS